MTTPAATTPQPNARATVGWWILVVAGALLLVDGAWVAANVGSPAVFEQDTGVALAVLQAEYPTVADGYRRLAINAGLMIVGIGLVLLVEALIGLRTRARAAWVGAAAALVPVAAVAVVILSAGSATVGLVWAAFAVVGALGLALTAGGAAAG